MDYFHQLYQLLYLQGHDAELTRIGSKRLCIRPQSGLNFPARDVFSVESDDETMVVMCQFLGLYGVDSPLPGYLNLHCIQEQVFRHFLDGINHRSYVLYFLSWLAFQPEKALLFGRRDYFDFVQGMAGFYSPCMALPAVRMAPHLARANVVAFLRTLKPEARVVIHEHLEDWVPVRQPQGMVWRLGENTLLGERIVERGARVQIDWGPMAALDAQALLHDEALKQWVFTYLQACLEESCALSIRIIVKGTPEPLQLGHSILSALPLICGGEQKQCTEDYEPLSYFPPRYDEAGSGVFSATIRHQSR